MTPDEATAFLRRQILDRRPVDYKAELAAAAVLRAEQKKNEVREPGADDDAPVMTTIGAVIRGCKMGLRRPGNDEASRYYRELSDRIGTRDSTNERIQDRRGSLAAVESAGRSLSIMRDRAVKAGDDAWARELEKSIDDARAAYVDMRAGLDELTNR